MLNRVDKDIEGATANCGILVSQTLSKVKQNLQKELISLPVGSCCVLNAWLICSADGESEALDFDKKLEYAILEVFVSVLCGTSDCVCRLAW